MNNALSDSYLDVEMWIKMEDIDNGLLVPMDSEKYIPLFQEETLHVSSEKQLLTFLNLKGLSNHNVYNAFPPIEVNPFGSIDNYCKICGTGLPESSSKDGY